MKTTLLATTLLIGSAISSFADTIEVEMLNQNEAGDRMVFSPEIIRAEVGDVIRFIPTDNSHNAQSVKDALPEGQEDFRGRMNQEVEYTVTEAGLTAVICLPHQVMGMVALVVVGDDFSNADQLLDARIPGKGMEKLETLIEEARATVPTAEDAAEQGS
jgi:pseudoazurin